jgi:hypothetical protein
MKEAKNMGVVTTFEKKLPQKGVEVEGGRVPTSDWMLNLQILTSGGFR